MANTESTNIVIRAEDRTRAAFTTAQQGLEGLKSRAQAVSGAISALGVGLSVAAIAGIAKSSINTADALNDLSARVGVSVRDLASFALAARLADTSLENVGAGIARLSRTIGEAARGNRTAAESLAELGITARDPKEAFLQLADAVERIKDPNRRAALLNAVLGKSYQELLPLLSQGGEGLRKAASEAEGYATAMEKLAPAAGEFNDRLDTLKGSFDEFTATVAGPGVKSLNEYLRAFTEIVNSGTALEKLAFFSVGYISERVANKIGDPGERVQAYNLEIAKLQQQLLELRRVEAAGSPNIERWEKRIAELEKARAEMVKAAREAAAAAKPASKTEDDTVEDLSIYGKQLQAALAKGFDTSKLDAFLATFKDRSKAIRAEYAALKAELEGGTAGEASSLDVSRQLTIGRSELAGGDAEGAQSAITKAKDLFKNLAAQDDTAGFEKSYFLRELERLETDVAAKAGGIAEKAVDSFREELARANEEAAALTVKVDEALVVRQVNSIYEQLQRQLNEKPLEMPIVPRVSTNGQTPVDLSTAALQYGSRR